jgi:hypothetical protein
MKADMISSAILFIFAALLYFLIPHQIVMIETMRLSMSPAFYPRVVIITMAVLSIIYFLSSYLKGKKRGDAGKESITGPKGGTIFGEHLPRTLATMALLVGYIYLMEFAGFLIATPIGLGAFMYHMGNRRIKVFCIVMIAAPLISYYFFEKVMLVILPRGILFY